jgi:serine/threonine protein kinase
MANVRYQALGPLMSGEGSRAFLGLEIIDEARVGPVVLVWVPQEATLDNERAEQVQRETQRAGLLEHPNIIRVYGLALLDEGLARVVEFADGEGLRQILESTKRLPYQIAARVVCDAAMGIHYAHLAGNDDGTPLVHGDLRPETMLVTHTGLTKVSGYGALSVAPREVGGSRVRGRRYHCAPEQLLGGRDSMNKATDVYLLALTLHECITGAVPFLDHEHFDKAVLDAPMPPLPDDTPKLLLEVIRKGMAKRATDRYQTAQAFRDAVGMAIPDVASNEEVAAFMREHFPVMAKNQAARQKALKDGIAEFAPHIKAPSRPFSTSVLPVAPAPRRPVQEAPPISNVPTEIEHPIMDTPTDVTADPGPAPKPPTVAPVASMSKPSPAKAPPPATRSAAPDWEDEPEPPKTSYVRLLAFGIVVVLVGLVVFKLADLRGKRSPPVATQVDPIPTLPPVAPAPDPTTAPTAAAIPSGTPETAVPQEPAKPVPPPVPAEPPSLALTSEPPLDVFASGKSLGRTPLTVPMDAGKHTLTLTNKQLGISLTRPITVKPRGKSSQHINVGKGSVAVTAPQGSVIFVDGIKKGVAPVEEFEVYEGSHRILVNLGKAKWSQPFKVRPTERMYFNVEEE